MKAPLLLFPLAFVLAGGVRAQAPAPAQPAVAAPGSPSTSTPPVVEPPKPDVDLGPAYAYEVGGRRDPFRSLLIRNPTEKDRVRPPGIPGLMVEELELQGTIRTKGGWIAMMRGADNRSHLIRKGQTLFDGEVTDINANEVVFRQNVNDPTNPKPFREVVKALSLQKKP